jgi:hypothetical protein
VRYLALTGRAKEAFDYATDVGNLPAGASMLAPEVQLEIALSRALAEGSEESRATAIKRFTAIARELPSRTGFAATVLCWLGQLDRAFSMFEGYFLGEGPWASGQSKRAYTSRLFGVYGLGFQQDPRFARLLIRTGLEDYWLTTGTRPDFRRFPQRQYRLPVG